MTQPKSSDSSGYPVESTESTQVSQTVTKEREKPEASQSPASPSSKRPWWIAIGIVLLLGFGFGGWRWWQSSHSETGASQQQAAGPQTVPVEVRSLQTSTVIDSSQYVGRLESRQSVVLRPEIQGRVSRIEVEPGATVTAGTPLIQLQPNQQSAELRSAQANLQSTRASRNNATAQIRSLQADRTAALASVNLQETQYQRTAALVREGALAREQLDIATSDRQQAIADLNSINQKIEAAQATLSEANAAVKEAQANVSAAQTTLQRTTINAPFAGTVGDIPVKIGSYVSPGDTLTSVTQNNPINLRLSIPITQRSRLRKGLRVELRDTQNNRLATGSISFISPQVDPNAQTILAKATFPNAKGNLQDGQYVQAEVIWEQRPGLLVPTIAVNRLGGQAFVYVARSTSPADEATQSQTEAEGKAQLVAQQVPVTLGEIQGNNYQVMEGLQVGDRVIVSGTTNLSDGVPIKSTPATNSPTS